MGPPGRPPRSRLRRLLSNRSRRAGLLVGFGYATAAIGVIVGLYGDPARPWDAATATAIGLLFVSFLAMFLASRTLVGIDNGR